MRFATRQLVVLLGATSMSADRFFTWTNCAFAVREKHSTRGTCVPWARPFAEGRDRFVNGIAAYFTNGASEAVWVDPSDGCSEDPNREVPGFVTFCIDWKQERGHFRFLHEKAPRCFVKVAEKTVAQINSDLPDRDLGDFFGGIDCFEFGCGSPGGQPKDVGIVMSKFDETECTWVVKGGMPGEPVDWYPPKGLP